MFFLKDAFDISRETHGGSSFEGSLERIVKMCGTSDRSSEEAIFNNNDSSCAPPLLSGPGTESVDLFTAQTVSPTAASVCIRETFKHGSKSPFFDGEETEPAFSLGSDNEAASLRELADLRTADLEQESAGESEGADVENESTNESRSAFIPWPAFNTTKSQSPRHGNGSSSTAGPSEEPQITGAGVQQSFWKRLLSTTTQTAVNSTAAAAAAATSVLLSPRSSVNNENKPRREIFANPTLPEIFMPERNNPTPEPTAVRLAAAPTAKSLYPWRKGLSTTKRNIGDALSHSMMARLPFDYVLRFMGLDANVEEGIFVHVVVKQGNKVAVVPAIIRVKRAPMQNAGAVRVWRPLLILEDVKSKAQRALLLRNSEPFSRRKSSLHFLRNATARPDSYASVNALISDECDPTQRKFVKHFVTIPIQNTESGALVVLLQSAAARRSFELFLTLFQTYNEVCTTKHELLLGA